MFIVNGNLMLLQNIFIKIDVQSANLDRVHFYFTVYFYDLSMNVFHNDCTTVLEIFVRKFSGYYKTVCSEKIGHVVMVKNI